MTQKEFNKLLKTADISFYDGVNGKTCLIKINGRSFSYCAPVGCMHGRKLKPFVKEKAIEMVANHYQVAN